MDNNKTGKKDRVYRQKQELSHLDQCRGERGRDDKDDSSVSGLSD